MPSQPTQEMFENLLAHELWVKAIGNEQWAMSNMDPATGNFGSPLSTHYPPIWIEDESQRIGLINIPPVFGSK